MSARVLDALRRDPSLSEHVISYGPSAAQIPATLQATLARLPPEKAKAMEATLREARYDPDLLAKLEAYAVDPTNPEEREWLVEAFAKVRAYFSLASRNARAMLLRLG